MWEVSGSGVELDRHLKHCAPPPLHLKTATADEKTKVLAISASESDLNESVENAEAGWIGKRSGVMQRVDIALQTTG